MADLPSDREAPFKKQFESLQRIALDGGTIGKAEAPCFAMIDEKGGINGRKINFINRDDGDSRRRPAPDTMRLYPRGARGRVSERGADAMKTASDLVCLGRSGSKSGHRSALVDNASPAALKTE